MVVLGIAGHQEEFGIWGQYLVAQANSVEDNDLNRDYIITRKVVPDFSKREVKCLVPVDEGGQQIQF